MMQFVLYFTIIILAYLFGSISSAIVVCKAMAKPDPRTLGSRNPGATNVLRIAGKKAAAITLAGDVIKGILPILIAKYLALPESIIGLTAIAAFLGHLYPIYFRFEGGKGVATLLGCLIALTWPASICWGIVWLLMAIIFRYSSLASLTASILAPFFVWYFTHSQSYTLAIFVMLPFLLLRHRNNIAALLRGNERKLTFRRR